MNFKNPVKISINAHNILKTFFRASPFPAHPTFEKGKLKKNIREKENKKEWGKKMERMGGKNENTKIFT